MNQIHDNIVTHRLRFNERISRVGVTINIDDGLWPAWGHLVPWAGGRLMEILTSWSIIATNCCLTWLAWGQIKRLNGIEKFRHRLIGWKGVGGHPHYMLLNLVIGGINGGDPTSTVFPNRLFINYVRVYQKNQTEAPTGK